jgi:hypothetical protein
MPEDIFDTIIICNNCNKPTERILIKKDGFNIRGWECKTCNKVWMHPKDKEDYRQFQEIRNRKFQVKLRLVGNSWTVSIPKEIIRFEEVNKTELIDMSMESPEKLVIFFKKISRRV